MFFIEKFLVIFSYFFYQQQEVKKVREKEKLLNANFPSFVVVVA